MKALLRTCVLSMLAGGATFGGSAHAALLKLDVTVTSADSDFSAPIFTFNNLSDSGFEVNSVSILAGPPWDFVYVGPAASPYEILNPAGGSRLITLGEESSIDPNNGCTSGISYSLSSFGAGDSFRFSTDPEAPGCGSAVIDIRSFLDTDQIGISTTFSNGTVLTGSDWTFEFIDPSGDRSEDTNQLYRLTLSAKIASPKAVPEPSTWAMMLAGFGAVGHAMRRRRRTTVSFA